MSISHRHTLFALSAIAFGVHGLASAQTAQSAVTTNVTLPETTVRATAEQELKQALGVSVITQEELSERIGRSRPQITNTLRLLRLPALVQRRVAAGVISQGHARAILGLRAA